jgi:hypothetical protein
VPIILCSLREIAVPFNLSKTQGDVLCWVVENSAKFFGLRAVHAAFRHAAELRESLFFWGGFYLPLQMQPGPSVFLQGVPRTTESLIRERKKIDS